MAGDVKVAVVSGVIASGAAGTADFTKAGFGTPKACIVLLSFDPTDNASVQAEGKASIGFSDFTNHRCIAHQDQDGAAKVNSDSRKSNTKAYISLGISGLVIVDGTASTIADGVRLTNTTNSGANVVFATIIMFGGADLQVSLDTVVVPSGTGSTTVTTTGIPQDLVFFIGVDITGEDSSSTGINNSFGVVDISDDQATIVNRCIGWASDHNSADGAPSSVIRTNRCLSIITEAGGLDWGIELTSATATAYTITTRDVTAGNGMEVYALALDLDDRGSKVGSVDAPTSGTSWTPSVALGFTPQYVGLGISLMTVENNIFATARAGSIGVSSNAGAGEETCHTWYNEDLVATTNTNNLFRSRVIDLRIHHTGLVRHDMSHSSFNDGDWTYTINSIDEATINKWFYWTIEEPATAGPTFEEAISLGSTMAVSMEALMTWGAAVSLGSTMATDVDVDNVMDVAMSLASTMAIAMAAENVLEVAVSLASTMATDIEGGLDFDVAMSLASTMAIAMAAENVLEAAVSLASTTAIDVDALVTFEAAMSLASTLAVAMVVENVVDVAASLASTMATDIEGGLDFDEAMSLASTMAIAVVAENVVDVAASLASTMATDVDADNVMDVAAALAATMATDVDAENVVDVAASLASTMAIGMEAGINFEGAVSLASTMAIAMVGELAFNEAISLGSTMATDAGADVVFEAALSLASTMAAAVDAGNVIEVAASLASTMATDAGADVVFEAAMSLASTMAIGTEAEHIVSGETFDEAMSLASSMAIALAAEHIVGGAPGEGGIIPLRRRRRSR